MSTIDGILIGFLLMSVLQLVMSEINASINNKNQSYILKKIQELEDKLNQDK